MSSKPSLDAVKAIWEEEEWGMCQRVVYRVFDLYEEVDFDESVTQEEVADEICKLVAKAMHSYSSKIYSDSKGDDNV